MALRPGDVGEHDDAQLAFRDHRHVGEHPIDPAGVAQDLHPVEVGHTDAEGVEVEVRAGDRGVGDDALGDGVR
jgi:hypothetical protein